MGSDRVPMFRESSNRHFLDLIEECCHALCDWRADACQVSALNERTGLELFSRDKSGGALSHGPSIIAIMLARGLIEQDNVSVLAVLADIAAKQDMKDIVHRYAMRKSEAQLLTNQTQRVVQTADDVYFMVAECIQGDWRNLARELAIAEYDIIHIQSYTDTHQSAALEMLNLFRHSEQHPDQMQRLMHALTAIGRSGLSQKVSSSLLSNAIRC